VTLASQRFRKGARFIHEYDLDIPWRHEVRVEDRLSPEVRKTYPVCIGGGGACPPEDCGGPANFMARRDDRFSFDALEDLDTMVEAFQQVALKDGSEPLALDQDSRWRLEEALERANPPTGHGQIAVHGTGAQTQTDPDRSLACANRNRSTSRICRLDTLSRGIPVVRWSAKDRDYPWLKTVSSGVPP
jgi:hypothetical protein